MHDKKRKAMPIKTAHPEREGGFVLITGLLFLIVMTLLVVSMMRSTMLDERMVGTARDWNVAFQAAEAALRDGEREVRDAARINGETGFIEGCSESSDVNGAGLCLPNPCSDNSSSGDCQPVWLDLEFKQNDTGWISGADGGKSVKYAESIAGYKLAGTPFAGVEAQPRYIIEVLTVPTAGSLKPTSGAPSFKYIYRITAVGFGASVKTRAMLQSVVRP